MFGLCMKFNRIEGAAKKKYQRVKENHEEIYKLVFKRLSPFQPKDTYLGLSFLSWYKGVNNSVDRKTRTQKKEELGLFKVWEHCLTLTLEHNKSCWLQQNVLYLY